MLENRPVFYTITDGTVNESKAKAFTSWFSLIWTLRFGECGEFELKTHDVENGLLYLPLYAIVFIHNDGIMMMVEDHEISRSKDGDVLTVTGRTLEAAWFSGRRTVHSSAPNYQLWNSTRTPQSFLVNDLMIGSSTASIAESLNHATYRIGSSANDLYSSHAPYATDRTDVYSEIEKMCKAFGFGIRSERPSTSDNKVRFSVYGEQNRKTQIYLHDKLGHFAPNTRLYVSVKDEFHDVIVLNETTSRRNSASSKYAGITDFRRRQAVVWSPQVPDGASVSGFFDQYIKDFLKTHTRRYLFDCSLSPHGYNTLIKSYGDIGEWTSSSVLGDILGDIISVSPKYHNGVLDMRIDEIVKSFGKDGSNTNITLNQVF